MSSEMRWGRVAALASMVALVACGGGGGGGDATGSAPPPPAPAPPPPPPPPSYPSSGAYGFLQKPNGDITGTITSGLSLIHPGSPAVEYEIEPITAAMSATVTVKSGTVDAAQGRVAGIASSALLYIVGGDIRRVPLVADGTAPASRVTKANTTTACDFTAEANDFASPDTSYYIVSTTGADGVCGTADDGAVEVRAGSGGITVGARTTTMAFLRDPATLAPAARVTPTAVDVFLPAAQSFAMASGGSTIRRVVGTSVSSMVFEWGTASATNLWFFDLQSGGSGVSLDAALTGGGNWELIGFDAGAYYVYRNDPAGTWKVLRITRTSPAATQLASGSGAVQVAAMGVDVLYLSTLGFSNNQLLRLSKTTAGAPAVVESTVTSTLTTMLTSASGVHQIWRVTNIGTASQAYQVEMQNEAGNTLYSASGGFIMGILEAPAQDLNKSENRTRFAFATGFGSRAFADAPLVVYDSATQSATTVGTLPGTAQFGNSAVFASIVSGTTDFIAGAAAPLVSNVVQGASTRVFSGQAGTAGSLSYTTTKN